MNSISYIKVRLTYELHIQACRGACNSHDPSPNAPGTAELPHIVAHRRELRALFPFFIGKPPVRDGVLRLLETGSLPMRPKISHVVHASEAAALYQCLFTPARNEMNAIVIDWRDAR